MIQVRVQADRLNPSMKIPLGKGGRQRRLPGGSPLIERTVQYGTETTPLPPSTKPAFQPAERVLLHFNIKLVGDVVVFEAEEVRAA